jgi:hypothetical protein
MRFVSFDKTRRRAWPDERADVPGTVVGARRLCSRGGRESIKSVRLRLGVGPITLGKLCCRLARGPRCCHSDSAFGVIVMSFTGRQFLGPNWQKRGKCRENRGLCGVFGESRGILLGAARRVLQAIPIAGQKRPATSNLLTHGKTPIMSRSTLRIVRFALGLAIVAAASLMAVQEASAQISIGIGKGGFHIGNPGYCPPTYCPPKYCPPVYCPPQYCPPVYRPCPPVCPPVCQPSPYPQPHQPYPTYPAYGQGGGQGQPFMQQSAGRPDPSSFFNRR